MDNQTEIMEVEYLNSQLGQFNFTESALIELQVKYSPLKIKDIEDKEGYLAVSAARKHVKALRVSVEKKRKELTNGYLKAQKAINGKAKSIMDSLSRIEDSLQNKEDIINFEKDRVKKEQEERENLIIAERAQKLLHSGFVFMGTEYLNKHDVKISLNAVKLASNDVFNDFYLEHKAVYDAEHAAFIAECKRLQEQKLLEEKRKSEELDSALAELERLQKIAEEKKKDDELKLFKDCLDEEQKVYDMADTVPKNCGLDDDSINAIKKAVQDQESIGTMSYQEDGQNGLQIKMNIDRSKWVELSDMYQLDSDPENISSIKTNYYQIKIVGNDLILDGRHYDPDEISIPLEKVPDFIKDIKKVAMILD